MKYLRLLKANRYNPVVVLLAISKDMFKLLMKTPSWVIDIAPLIIVIGALIGLAVSFIGQ